MEVSFPLAWLIYIGKLIKYRQDISVLGSFLLILLSYTLSETDYSCGRLYYFLLSNISINLWDFGKCSKISNAFDLQCWLLVLEFAKANRVDPDQTASLEAV